MLVNHLTLLFNKKERMKAVLTPSRSHSLGEARDWSSLISPLQVDKEEGGCVGCVGCVV